LPFSAYRNHTSVTDSVKSETWVASPYYPTTQARVIYLGFGFEALNRPTGHPTYESRVTFFQKCFDWLIGASGIVETGTLPPDPQPLSAQPNPFHDRTTITYSVPRAAEVNAAIYDIRGRAVATLVNGRQPAGRYNTTWNRTDSDGNRIASGVYFCRLTSGTARTTRKLIVE